MATNQAGMTAEELLALGDIGRCELIQGELVRMSPSGFHHGIVSARVCRLLADHVDPNHLGVVTGAETGFKIARDPDTVRAPDAAFIAKEHLPDPLPQRGFFPGPPDLAIEVVSPDDSWSEVNAKAIDWLAAGCKLVWVVDPATRSLTAYAPGGKATRLGTQAIADADPVIRGLKVPVSEIFAGLPAPG